MATKKPRSSKPRGGRKRPAASKAATTSKVAKSVQPSADVAGSPPVASGIVPANYISNPFGLIRPSLQALRLNWPIMLMVVVGGLLVLVALITAMVSTAAIAIYVHNLRATLLALLATLALAALAVMVIFPLAVIVLLDSAKSRKLKLRDSLQRCWHYWWRIFLAMFLASLATLGGLVLLIVPGIVFGTWFSLAVYVIVDEDTSAMEGLRRSRQLVRNHLVEMLGLYGLGEFLNFIPVIGSLISVVLALLSLASPAVRYLQLKELAITSEEAVVVSDGSQPTRAPAHWLNWLVIVLAAVSLLTGGYQGLRHVNQLDNRAGSPSSTDNTNLNDY